MSPARHVRRLAPFALVAAAVVVLASATARAQSDVRSPLPAPVKVKQGMTNVPALSPLWLLPESACSPCGARPEALRRVRAPKSHVSNS